MKMNNIVEAFQFSIELRRLNSLQSCTKLFRSRIAEFGFDTFACGELDLQDRDRVVFYLIDWPDRWRNFYISSGLHERDPVVDLLAKRREPFTWSDLRADRSFPKVGQKALDLCAAEGWSEGLVIPFGQVGSRVGLVSMAGHRCDLTVEARAYLCIIAICLHSHVRALVPKHGFAAPPVGLTDREMASLRLVAKGRTDAEIGQNMGISRSTAHEFVEKAKRRLNVKSRAELVCVATSLGIIDC